jgi:hypothetical protein
MSTPYCRHIRTTGRRCAAFAMRGQSFCYAHRISNARHRTLARPDVSSVIKTHNLDLAQLDREPLTAEYYGLVKGPLLLDFPPIEDRDSIQLALSMMLTALGQDRLDPKRATVMLYNLQIASANASKLNHDPEGTVRDTVIDDNGDELAPDVDPEDLPDNSTIAKLLREFGANDIERAKEANLDSACLPSSQPSGAS